MARSERLSLDTVWWPNRLVALVIALFVAIVLIPPSMEIRNWMLDGVPLTPQKLVRDLMDGATASIAFFPFFLTVAAKGWGLPGLLMFHIALRRRANFIGFIVSGILAGILGAIIVAVFRDHGPNEYGYGTYFELYYLRPMYRAVRLQTLVVSICGGGGAAVAWCYMWLVRKRDPSTNGVMQESPPLFR